MGTVSLNDVNYFVESLISSYESRISNIEAVFNNSDALNESSFDLLKDFNNSLKDYRTERNTINSQLRENLAKNGSLRKKDYNRMMENVLNKLDEKERETEKYFFQFIEDQKAILRFLKKGILDIKDSIQDDNTKKLITFRQELNHISHELEAKKEAVVQRLLDYQIIHQKTIEKFKMLLAKGDRIFIRDVKEVHRNLLREVV